MFVFAVSVGSAMIRTFEAVWVLDYVQLVDLSCKECCPGTNLLHHRFVYRRFRILSKTTVLISFPPGQSKGSDNQE